jgi:glycosyltransferase involved in cell wall biosynthesis
MHIAIVSVNHALLTSPLGDDVTVLRSLGAEVDRLSVIVATPYAHQARSLSSNVFVIPARARTRPQGLLSIVRTLVRLHRDQPLDLVQAQEPIYTGLGSFLATRRTRSRMTVCAFGTDPEDAEFRSVSLAHRLSVPLARYVLRRATVVQTDSKTIAARMGARGLPVRYKPMTPVNLGEFLEHGKDRCHREPANALLYVGRLGRQKRVRLLLDTLSFLRKSRPDARLTIVGDGPERSALGLHAEAIGVSGAVDFRGQLPHSQLVGAYLEADLLVLGSLYEGMPRVFLEAAATALPIVSTPVAGAIELAEQASVPIADPTPRGLAGAIANALDDADFRAQAGGQLRELMEARVKEPPPPLLQLRIWREAVA